MTSAIAAIGALMLGIPAQADIQTRTPACSVGGGPGFIIGSSRPLNCTYSGSAGPEHYVGNIAKLGVDIGYLAGGEIVWQLIAPTAYPRPGSLAGSYRGVTRQCGSRCRVGANALVGGSNRSFTLQPVSVEGQTGFDVSGGLGNGQPAIRALPDHWSAASPAVPRAVRVRFITLHRHPQHRSAFPSISIAQGIESFIVPD